MTDTFEMPEHRCPFCGSLHDHATNTTTEAKPNAGDVSICFDCTSIGVFDENGSVRKPTEEEKAVFLADSRVQTVIAARTFQLAGLL